MANRGAGAIAPPDRSATKTKQVFTDEKSSGDVRITARIAKEQGTYLKVLSAKTSTPQKDLLEQAIELLRDKHGDI